MSQNQASGLVERHGGLVISAAFHFAIFMLLQNITLPQARIAQPPEPEPIRIELQPATAPEPPADPTPTPAPVLIPQNIATVAEAERGNPDDLESGGEESPDIQVAAARPQPAAQERQDVKFMPPPAPANEPAEEIPAPEPASPSQQLLSEDTSDQPLELDSRIKAYLEDREKQLNAYNDQIGMRGSDSVAQKLQLARVELEGKRWLETTEGGQEGVVRSFDTSKADPKIVEEVFARYGIQSFHAYVDDQSGGGAKFGYVNAARVGGQQYVRRSGQGMFQVLSIPSGALARLAQLERDALQAKGLDPAKTRLLEVEFGIASVGGTFDFVVSNMKAAPIEIHP